MSLCEEGRLARSDSQTSCGVDPDAELGVFVVLGRQLPVNEDDVWPDKGVSEDKRDEHDGEQWLAICSEDVATHMAHQGFTMATKIEEECEPGLSGDQSQLAANLVKEAGRPAQGRRKRQLVRLAELKGRDLVGLSVRCTGLGAEHQESRMVPISPYQPDSKAKGEAKGHIVFVASGGDDTTPPIYPLSMTDKQRLERVLASRDTFRHSACSKNILSFTGERCIVALEDSYYLPLAASPEWKAQVRQVIDDTAHHGKRPGCRVRHLLGLLATGEWHIARYGGTGIPLPWSPQMVIQFVDPVEVPYQGWGPRPSSGGVTLARFGASLAGLKRVTGVRFRAGEDENYVRWAQLPDYPELRYLYKVYFVMLSFYRHSSMRPDNYRRCVLVLWAHLRDPGSAFGQLPLELVVHILRLTRASSRQVHLELAGDFVLSNRSRKRVRGLVGMQRRACPSLLQDRGLRAGAGVSQLQRPGLALVHFV